mgnify:CR=1 FL=1
MSDNNEDTTVSLPGLSQKRYVLGCPQCDGTHWTIILSEDQVRFDPDDTTVPDIDVVFQSEAMPTQAAECLSCGYSMELINTSVLVTH